MKHTHANPAVVTVVFLATALVLSTASGSPFKDCLSAPACPSATAACVGLTQGNACHYCDFTYAQWTCQFTILMQCTQLSGAPDCGNRWNGTCDDTGTCIGTRLEQEFCSRTVCVSAPL